MRRLTVALTVGVALVLSFASPGLPRADAAVRCDVRGATAPRVIDVTHSGSYATVRGCQRQSNGTYRDSESAVRVPAGDVQGDAPPPPYSAAGTCA